VKNDVLIVGAGPVGLINGLLLARQGVRVTVIDEAPGIVDSPRAMSYAWSILDALDYHGLLTPFQAKGFPINGRGFFVFNTREWIVHKFDCLRGWAHHPYTLTLGQELLAEILLNLLEEQPTAQVLWNTRFVGVRQDPQKVSVEIERDGKPETLEASWLIGCDGGRSPVRKALDLSFDGVTWPRRFVATNMYHTGLTKEDWPASYIVDTEYGAVIAKINQNNLWRVTFSEPESMPREGVEERIDAFAKKALPQGSYELTLHSIYSMHQRTAPKYRVGRVLLAGDAAHVTNPTSGFGLMGGMYDSFCLAEALGAVIMKKHDDEILDRYAKARRDVFLSVTSPISSDSLRMGFYNNVPERLEHDLITMRQMRDDPAFMRRALMAPALLETPSLLDGKTFRDRLSEQGNTPAKSNPYWPD
jgi:3-(3-hydroxy-phenyl)propionate hydroxylase